MSDEVRYGYRIARQRCDFPTAVQPDPLVRLRTDFTLEDGDVVSMEATGIGTLTNPVVKAK